MASESNLYHELLAALADREEIYSGKLVATNAKCGASSKGDLLVIGRALNQWDDDGFPISELRGKRDITKEVASILRVDPSKDSCPLAWVVDHWGHDDYEYNTARSAFWRVARKTSRALDLEWADAKNWSSHLVWSNLYKASPADGPNPGNKLCSAQLDACQKILNFELETFRPARVLMLTGYDWAYDFVTEGGFSKAHGRNGKVEWSGIWKSGKSTRHASVVVCPHPQGKPEEPIVRDAVKSFKLLEDENS